MKPSADEVVQSQTNLLFVRRIAYSLFLYWFVDQTMQKLHVEIIAKMDGSWLHLLCVWLLYCP